MPDFCGRADRADSPVAFSDALASGATVIGAGAVYRSGQNETVVAEALEGRRRDKPVIGVQY